MPSRSPAINTSAWWAKTSCGLRAISRSSSWLPRRMLSRFPVSALTGSQESVTRCQFYLQLGLDGQRILPGVGSALKTPHVSQAVRRRVGAAAALAETLLERRGPALTRRLTPRERTVEIAAAVLFAATAVALAMT